MKSDKTFFIIISLFLFAGVISWNFYYKQYVQKDTVNIHEFPKEFNGWTSEEIELTEREYAVLETRNAFTREYTNTDGKSVYLFIVYSQTNRKVAHPPEVCYAGSGAVFTKNIHRRIPLADGSAVPANKILVDLKAFQQMMYYWFKVGDTFTSNYWKQQMLIAFNTLTGKPAGSALIRLSSSMEEGEDPETAALRIEVFAKEIIPLLYTYLP